MPSELEDRVLAGRAFNEDAVVVSMPQGMGLVQTVDILSPIVNDGFAFGRIAACKALSDVYAMGGRPWSAMSVACFPEDLAENAPGELAAILRGALDAMHEAGCVSAGGHTVKDDELKFGLAVSGVVDPAKIAQNSGLAPGMKLVLTKPIGSGILATALKASWEGWEDADAQIRRWCGRLNRVAGEAIARFGIRGATDVTGFGLAGHALELARASRATVRIVADAVPLMDRVLGYAGDGLVPAGTIGNRKFCACRTKWERDKDEDLENALFDAQPSGGLLLGVEPERLAEVQAFLTAGGDLACVVGDVLEQGDALLLIG